MRQEILRRTSCIGGESRLFSAAKVMRPILATSCVVLALLGCRSGGEESCPGEVTVSKGCSLAARPVKR